MKSLRSRLVVLQLGFAAVIFASLLLFIRFDLYPTIQDMERKDARDLVTQFQIQLSNEVQNLNRIVLDWAHWDIAYRYVQQDYPSFEEENLTIDFFETMDVNIVAVYSKDGDELLFHMQDAEGSRADIISMESYLINQVAKVKSDVNQDFSRMGLYRSGGHLYLYAVAGITDSNLNKQADGLLMMARKVDQKFTQQLSDRILTKIKIKEISFKDYWQLETLLGSVSADGKNIEVFTTIDNYLGEPIALVTLQLERKLYGIGLRSLYAFSFFALAACVLSLALLSFASWYLVSNPLHKLANTVEEIGDGKEAEDLPTHREDELGVVARAIREMHGRAIFLANHDPLTSLPNRKIFQEAFAYAAGNVREGSPKYFALFVIDLDGFKAINDTQGHAAGDMVLKTVSSRFRASLRDADLVARMGGDEFAILCARVTTEEEMKQIAAKLIKVCGEPIQLENGELVHVGASIGALIINKACSMDEIYAKADEALYESKNSGKNCCKIRTL